MKHKSYLTAITRKTLPAPTRWLIKNEFVREADPYTLDYGCGKCGDTNPHSWTSYDPHYEPLDTSKLTGKYGRIICNYVLCTLPAEERLAVLQDIQRCLHVDGLAFISVRNDKPKQGWGLSSKGTYQGRVEHLPGTLVYKNSQFRIYMLRKTDRLA